MMEESISRFNEVFGYNASVRLSDVFIRAQENEMKGEENVNTE